MDRHAGKRRRLAMTMEFVIARSAATKQSMQRVAAISSVGRSTTRLGVTGRCMDRSAGELHRLAFFCHCEELATKQSMHLVAAISSVGRSTTRRGFTGLCTDHRTGIMLRYALIKLYSWPSNICQLFSSN